MELSRSRQPQRQVKRMDSLSQVRLAGWTPLQSPPPPPEPPQPVVPTAAPLRRDRYRLPLRRIVIGGLVLAGIAVAATHGAPAQRAALARPAALVQRVETAVSGPSQAQLEQQLGAIFSANPKVTVGVAVENLSAGSSVQTYGQTQPMTAASTTKLITAADFLHQVEAGRYSLYGPLGVSTAGAQLEELVNDSDNDSWALFDNLLGDNQVTAYAHQIGLSSYEFNTNTITPADEATLLQELYQGKLLSQGHTQLLLSYMQHTNDEALIPAALPAGATVYHKYGELLESSGNYLNDAAIITNNGQTFVLTIYTDRSDMLDYPTRLQIIHQITQDVVAYER